MLWGHNDRNCFPVLRRHPQYFFCDTINPLFVDIAGLANRKLGPDATRPNQSLDRPVADGSLEEKNLIAR
jgi:hypothetical protein